MMQTNAGWVLGAIVSALLLALAPTRIHAEDASQDPEAQEATKEDEAEKKLTENEQIAALKNVKGKIVLGTPVPDNPDVVGQILADSGESYFLKLASKDLLKRLQAYDNKTATLSGKLRNKDKYLVVQGVSDPGGSTNERTKRGGV